MKKKADSVVKVAGVLIVLTEEEVKDEADVQIGQEVSIAHPRDPTDLAEENQVRLQVQADRGALEGVRC